MNTKSALRALLARAGYEIRKSPPAGLWKDDPEFRSVLGEIRGYTLVAPVRCYMLWQFARSALQVPGDFAELGVYRGGTARLLARAVQRSGRRLDLFDTFAGLPASDTIRDQGQTQDFTDTSVEAVQKYLRGLDNLEFYAGLFPASAATVKERSFSFVHADADIYSSMKACCEFFYPRLTPGGFMVCDDYGLETWPGATAAIDEFFADKPERPWRLGTGQCVIQRSPAGAG
ncbi:MAG: TylF/MycF/NovP-related O-methyltransferase [Candidatus Binataceae bacterium]